MRNKMPNLDRPNVLNWASIVDDNTLDQAEETGRLPFLAGHVALMPDAHYGRGATIGSVIPTRGAIVPATVGVDLGCGMIAGNLGIKSSSLGEGGPLHVIIREAVPAGMGKAHLEIDNKGSDDLFTTSRIPRMLLEDDGLLTRARKQYGTLGGGNHFVEISLDEDDNVWLVLHSGSRGVGNTLASSHISNAKDLMKQYFIEPPNPDLAYLVAGTPEFDEYIYDMRWAQRYAYMQREKMFNNIIAGLEAYGLVFSKTFTPINCHHNYCTKENHHGKNCWITRKGAISARKGELGIIPGSMGTDTYIVRGLGSAASYQSASHGAGRVLSRTAARRDLTTDSLREAMAGKSWNDRDANAVLDEHPASYKPIEQVMRDQADLVEPVARLEQIVSYKGTK